MVQVTDCSARNDKSGTETAPRIWVLTGNKTGDNAQVLRAVTATGLAYEVRNIVIKPHFDRVKPRVYPSLHHVDRARSSALLAPWPDVVVAIGRRMSLVALWIRQQSLGRCRIALFNAPKSRTARFDLAVVPSYYRMTERPEVCRIGLPLIAADPVALADAQRRFATSLGAMPKPLHVLLLGGATGQMGFSSKFAGSVLTRMQESFAASGSIFVSTSRRTPSAAAEAIERRLRPPDRLYRWRAGGADNPYLGLLAHGDTFTVTGDSLSMLTEVARLGKPLVIAELPEQRRAADAGLGFSLRRFRRFLGGPPARDFQLFFDLLVDGGHAVRLGEAPHPPPALPRDDTLRVAQRLIELARAPCNGSSLPQPALGNRTGVSP